jgi:hypothetical protein
MNMKYVFDLLDRAIRHVNCGEGSRAQEKIETAIVELKKIPRYETPKQYKERTGRKVKENDAVYHRHAMKNWYHRTMQTHPYYWGPWFVKSYGAASEYEFEEGHSQLVVATEAGCPPDNWTPEEDAGCPPNKWLPEDEVRELS